MKKKRNWFCQPCQIQMLGHEEKCVRCGADSPTVQLHRQMMQAVAKARTPRKETKSHIETSNQKKRLSWAERQEIQKKRNQDWINKEIERYNKEKEKKSKPAIPPKMKGATE